MIGAFAWPSTKRDARALRLAWLGFLALELLEGVLELERRLEGKE